MGNMTKPKRTLAELDKLIPRTEKFLAQIKEERREVIRTQQRAMPRKKPGRKQLDKDILELAKKLAQRKPLTEVALQLNVSLRSLYNKGISRASIDAEKAKKADCQTKGCEKMVKRKITDTIPIAGMMIEVEDAPARVCENCEEIYFDGRFILDLEEKLLKQQNKATENRTETTPTLP